MTQDQDSQDSRPLDHLDSGLNILFLAAMPMLLWLFQGSFSGIATGLAMIWLLTVALRLIATGQAQHRAYDAAVSARRPRVPRKIIGSVLMGVLVVFLAGHRFDALLLPLFCGVLATVLSLIAFGPDPLRDKGDPNAEAAIAARAQAEEKAESLDLRLVVIVDSLDMLNDADIVRRTEAVRLSVLAPLRQQVGSARRFDRILSLGAKLADLLETEAQRLLDAQNARDHAFARRRFVAKLDVMAESFAARVASTGASARIDAFDQEAERLLHRMPRESAA